VVGKDARRKREAREAREKKQEKPGAQPRTRVFENIRRATVAFGIRDDATGDFDVKGSGFFVDASGILVTAKHVVERLDELQAEGAKAGKTMTPAVLVYGRAEWRQAGPEFEFSIKIAAAKIVKQARHADKDIAVVKVNPPEPMTALATDYAMSLHEGDAVGTCGFPYGLEVHEGKTIISSFLTGVVSAVVPHPVIPAEGRTHYLLQIPANPGNSGGAVFDPDTGCVVGVISRGFAPRKIPTGLTIAEPIHLARNLIAECRKP
jgi:serine protease Do